MQVTLQHNSDTRKSLEIVFPAPMVESAFGDVLSDISTKVKLPGFRAGRVPKNVLISKYKPQIEKDVSEKLIESHFWEAASTAGVQPISRPAIEKADINEGAEGKVKVQFDVAPVVVLPDYKGAVLVKKKRRIDDDAVNDALEAMRENAAKLVPVEDGAAVGHIVTFNLKAKPQGMKPRSYTGQQILLAENKPFDAEFLGLKVDETKKFTIQTPENDPNRTLAGKQVHYEVTVSDVRVKTLADIDDEFAKDVGDFESLVALKDKVRKDLEESSEGEAIGRLQSNLLDSLLDACTFDVPSSMVNLQIDDYCREFVEVAAQRGLSHRQVNWSAYRRHRLVDAERAVRSGYLLQALGNAEDIQVSEDEIDKEIYKWMEESKPTDSFASIKASLEKRGATTEIKGRIRTDKIFEMLLESATITEELLDKKAYIDLLEVERRRDEGIAQARFDAGGLEGGNLDEQEGGEPEAIVPAVDATNDVAEDAAKETVEGKEAKEDMPPEVKPLKRERKKPDVSDEDAKPVDSPTAKRNPKKDALSGQAEDVPIKRSPKKTATVAEPEEAPIAKRGRPKKVVHEADDAKEKPKSPSKK